MEKNKEEKRRKEKMRDETTNDCGQEGKGSRELLRQRKGREKGM